MVFGAVENVAHFPRQTVGLVDTANLRIAKTSAEQAGKLSVAVDAFVVHFDDQDVVETGENIFQTVGQWIQVAKVRSLLVGGLLFGFLGGDPAVGAGVEEVEGEGAGVEHLVVEGAEVEAGA